MKKAIGMLLALAFCLTACAPAAAPESAAADTADTAQQEASAPASAAGALPAGALRSSGTLGDTGEARYTVASSLQDFTPGTTYELQVLLLADTSLADGRTALHSNIQDVFNEFGVQIMSPNFVMQPKGTVMVAKEDWYAAPAAQDPQTTEG